MPYDYYLEPENEQRMFTERTLEEMQQYLRNIPHHKFGDRLYYVFEDESRKQAGVVNILERIARNKNIYTHSSIGFFPTKIRLSIIGDSDVDIHIYKFVVWCQKHYPCQLYEEDRPVPPEELFPFEEEGFVPLID